MQQKPPSWDHTSAKGWVSRWDCWEDSGQAAA